MNYHWRREVRALIQADGSEWWDADFPEEHLEKLTVAMMTPAERGDTVAPTKWARYYLLPFDPVSDLCFSHSMAEGRLGKKPPTLVED